MHTFFINTSPKRVDQYGVLFDISYANRVLVAIPCELENWFDEKQGYMRCVARMSRMIDCYDNLDNAYNLIIFFDLSLYKHFRFAFQQTEQDASYSAGYVFFTHLVSSTILDQLSRQGRMPKETIILFGEDKKHYQQFSVQKNYLDNLTKDALFRMIGLPAETELHKIAEEINQENKSIDEKKKELKNRLLHIEETAMTKFAMNAFSEDLDLLCDDIMRSGDTKESCNTFYDCICSQCNHDKSKNAIYTVGCPGEGLAEEENKSALALNRLNLACYILSIAYAKTAFVQIDNDKTIRPFHEYTSGELIKLFKGKQQIFIKKLEELDSLNSTFQELKLAPDLYKLENERFGLDEYGRNAVKLVEMQKDEDDEETDEDEKVIETQHLEPKNILGKEVFEPFDYSGEVIDDNLKEDATANQYVKAGKEIRRHHLDYLKKWKINIADKLSHYAGRSGDNTPSTLPKRRVSDSDPKYQDGAKEYHYTSKSEKETKQLGTVQSVSSEAYNTALTNYMLFSAGRSVTLTDIEKECNWFVTKIRQIQAAQKKLKTVLIGMIIAVVVLYLPYVILQWDTITKPGNSLSTVAMTFGLPIFLLVTITTAVFIWHKRRLRMTWEELKRQSDRVLKQNTLAASKFEQLLYSVIPSLRWLYEYKLDVEFYTECCKYAAAKLKHHKEKLKERIAGLQTMIQDLENINAANEESYIKKADAKIDYNVAYCSGDNNIAFYSIIDSDFLNADGKQGE